ncbi:MAG: alpha-galactosidase [Anaerolineae bacterium]|nr:alpha-galactosidase [Anaerolineae bacterium]
MTRVAIIGAGSTVFAVQMMIDTMAIEGLDAGSFALVDIDGPRLERAHKIAEKVVGMAGKGWTVEASTERHDVLEGCDYIINTIEVSGLQTVKHDYEIPMKYGVDQCIGDTIGPGGLFKALRTGPAWIDILRDAEELCPEAVVLNYTNPMSLLMLAAFQAVDMPMVGLCHSVQGSSMQLAGYLGIPYPELEWKCAGINHNAWFTELKRGGEDMYPVLRERIKDPNIYELDPVRFEVMKYLGAFVTESSGHFSEYVPYFRKRPELIEKYCRAHYLGESGFYAREWPKWRAGAEQHVQRMIDGEEPINMHRSHEYASYIVEAVEHNKPTVIYGNVMNYGSIDNLPQDGCVEVACLVDRNGIQPTYFGALPEQLAALNRAHMAFHELAAQAILNFDKQAAKYALMIDPLTAAVCSLDEIDQMFEEMFEAERDYLPGFE